MQARRTLILGHKSAKKFLEHYGEQLVCVRYRYEEHQLNVAPPSNSLSDESGWRLPEKLEIVGLRVGFQETELQRRAKQAGGKWNSVRRGESATGRSLVSD